jgi:hypothetical protein
MALWGDISDIRELWKKSPPLVKALLGLLLFLSISSIASLSDDVFKWKGFILEGIGFYRLWIGAFINYAFGWVGLHFSSRSSDFITIWILAAASALRADIATSDYSDRSERVGSALIVLVLLIGTGVILWRLNGLMVGPSNLNFALPIAIYLLLPFVLKFEKNTR